jgi:hypothetical protein
MIKIHTVVFCKMCNFLEPLTNYRNSDVNAVNRDKCFQFICCVRPLVLYKASC